MTDEGVVEILTVAGHKLRELYLGSTNITGQNWHHLLSFDLLQRENGNGNVSTKEEEESTCKTDGLSHLLHLDLDSCGLTDEGVVQVVRSCGGQLKELMLDWTTISGESWQTLPTNSLPNLHKLSMHGCSRLSDQGVVEVLNRCGDHLQQVNLRQTRITGESWALIRPLHHVNKLQLTTCKLLTHQGVREILNKCDPTKTEFSVKNLKVGSSF